MYFISFIIFHNSLDSIESHIKVGSAFASGHFMWIWEYISKRDHLPLPFIVIFQKKSEEVSFGGF